MIELDEQKSGKPEITDKVKNVLMNLESIDRKFSGMPHVYQFARCLGEIIPPKADGSKVVFFAQELSSQLFCGSLFPPQNYDLLRKLNIDQRADIYQSIPFIIRYLPPKTRKQAEEYLARQKKS